MSHLILIKKLSRGKAFVVETDVLNNGVLVFMGIFIIIKNFRIGPFKLQKRTWVIVFIENQNGQGIRLIIKKYSF